MIVCDFCGARKPKQFRLHVTVGDKTSLIRDFLPVSPNDASKEDDHCHVCGRCEAAFRQTLCDFFHGRGFKATPLNRGACEAPTGGK